MAIKKYTLLAFFLFFMAGGAFAQLAGILDYSDSSKVPAKRMAQQNEWANGLPGSPFPARPRDAWQFGVFGGYAGLFSDVNTAPGYNLGLSLRKALGYMLSVRGSLSYAQITGLSYERTATTRNIPLPARNAYAGIGQLSFAPYFRSEVWNPSVDVLLSLNNIVFHRKQSNYNFYALVGYSPISYRTNLEVVATDGSAHTYTGVNFAGKRSDIKDQMNSFYESRPGGIDFETPANTRARRNNFGDGDRGARQWRHAYNLGAGFERRLGDIVSISGEFKYTTPWGDDYVDGIVIGPNGSFTPQNDAFFFGNVSMNFNLGLKSRKKFLQQAGKDDGKSADLGQFPGKRVAPLWMHNPLGQPYGELSNPTRMNIPKGWLEDSDGDGVIDQFDLEPNTPAGVPVDTRGRSRDTDGDGVPDYTDKELITPTACQPVNAEGVGKCPDPECCKDLEGKLKNMPPSNDCNIGSLPSVQFTSGRSGLSSSANAILDAAADQIRMNPSCKICVVGHGGSSKREQQLSWDRVNAVINYMVETKGLGRDRFVFKYGQDGDANTVDLQDCSDETGSNNVPIAPYPQYRSKN